MRKDKTPYVPPVKHIELDEKKIKPRLILTIVFFIIAIIAITYGVISMNSTDDGWRNVEVLSKLDGSCIPEIAFQYNLGASGIAAGVEYRELSKVYTEAADNATKFFNNRYYVDTSNLRTLNDSPNSDVAVAQELYDALKLLSDSGRREMFYAPYYDEYTSLFLCVDENEAYNFDPKRNPEVEQYINSLSAYVGDENHVSLTFGENNTLRLNVSDEYLAFAEDYGITSYVDLYWMKNAFVVDYIAKKLMENGFYFGSLSTFDGYVRNLDKGSGYNYGFNLYDKVEDTVNPAAIMSYSGQISVVNYRSYPMTDLDAPYYSEDADGNTLSKYIGGNGYPASATGSLVMFSREKSCAEILVSTMEYYLADTLDTTEVENIPEISCVYCEDSKVVTNSTDEKISFDSFYDGYTLEKVK
mgnify:FL=1